MHVCIYLCMSVLRKYVHVCVCFMYVCMYVSSCSCMYDCMYVLIDISVSLELIS